jgi:transcriptional regulator with XRE-family HTH domain
MTYRDVEEASQWIADEHGNHAFLVGISRLADIENKGTTPSLYKLYSLAAIYRVEYSVALRWFGIDIDRMAGDAAHFSAQQTQPFALQPGDNTLISFPLYSPGTSESLETRYFSRAVRFWGKLPLALLNSMDLRRFRYAFIGTDDWSMYPILPPGSFVQIDEKKRKVVTEGWNSEFERPIYFVEYRGGFRCGWCSLTDGMLLVQPHHSSSQAVLMLPYPDKAEVLGQVVGVAMRLDQGTKRRTHS